MLLVLGSGLALALALALGACREELRLLKVGMQKMVPGVGLEPTALCLEGTRAAIAPLGLLFA